MLGPFFSTVSTILRWFIEGAVSALSLFVLLVTPSLMETTTTASPSSRLLDHVPLAFFDLQTHSYSTVYALLSVPLHINSSISQSSFSILNRMCCFTPSDYVKSRNDLKFVCHHMVTVDAHSIMVLDNVTLWLQRLQYRSRSLRYLISSRTRYQSRNQQSGDSLVRDCEPRPRILFPWILRFRYSNAVPFTVPAR